MSASIIRIKRSQVAGNPSVLANGELAYSALPNNDTNGGDRLYIGIGNETNGNAANHFVIGGKYFTDLMDHTRGVLEADSAILVDSNKKINELFVDNLGFDGNEISSTDSNGNILITPDGTGKTIVSNLFIDDDQTSIEDYVQQVSFDNFDIVGTADIGVSEDDNVFTISLEDTTVDPDTYGSATEVPVVTVDGKGRITNVTTESISTDFDVSGDTGTGNIELLTDSFEILTGTNAGISTEVAKVGTVVTATISLDQDLSTSGSPTFDDGTFTGDVGINGGDLTTTATTFNLIDTNATTVNAFGSATIVTIGAETGTTTVNNNLEVDGDLTVRGSLTSLETITLQTDDPLVKFGRGNPADLFSIGFYGEYTANSVEKKTGLFRSHVTKEYFLFDELVGDITTDNIVNTDGLSLASLNIENLSVVNVIAGGNVNADEVIANLFIGEIDGGTY